MDIKLTTTAPDWPWLRQTPGGKGQWGPFNFMVDRPAESCDAWVVFESLQRPERTFCSPDRLVFVTGEPESIGRYHPGFLAQFKYVVTSRRDIRHPGVINLQQGHPWFVEKSYDDLLTMQPPEKSAGLCAILSDKNFTGGHRERLEFIRALKDGLGDLLDVYGRGIRDFDSKWDLLSRYRYTIALENCEVPDFLTEKLPDAWLAFCYPFYIGCTNTNRYFPIAGFTQLNLNDPRGGVATIRAVIQNETHYPNALDEIVRARDYYLRHQQFFANISTVLQYVLGRPCQDQREVVLRPNTDFGAGERRHGAILDRLARIGQMPARFGYFMGSLRRPNR